MFHFSPHAQSAAKLLCDLSHSISVAESSTGGMISASLLSVPGASRYFKGGAVIYTAKSRLRIPRLKQRAYKATQPLN